MRTIVTDSTTGQRDAVVVADFATPSMLRERHGAKTIRANAVWMLVANGMFAFSRWAIVVILAKLGSQELVGQYGLAVAMCLPTITVCRFGLRILQSTDAHNELSFGDYLSFALVATPIGLVIVAVLMFAKGSAPDFVALVMVVALWNSIESISDLFSGLFQRYERIDYLAKAYILQASLMVGLMLVGFAATHSLLVGVCGLVFAAVVRLLGYELPIGGKLVGVNPADGARRIPLAEAWAAISPKLSWRAVRGILVAGTPLAIVTFLMAYTASAPRFVIDDVLKNPARLGVFVALLSLASAQNLIVGGVAQSLASPLAILFVQRERARLVRLISKAMAPGFVCFVTGPGDRDPFRQTIAVARVYSRLCRGQRRVRNSHAGGRCRWTGKRAGNYRQLDAPICLTGADSHDQIGDHLWRWFLGRQCLRTTRNGVDAGGGRRLHRSRLRRTLLVGLA